MNDHDGAIRVCVLGLGGGGHHFQIEKLFSAIDGKIELTLVYVVDSQVDTNWSSPFPVHRAFVVRSPSLLRDHWGAQIWRTPLAIGRSLAVLLSDRPDCIVAIGTAHAIPFGIAAKLLSIPMIFVESITRVETPSRTSRWVRRLRLARKLYCQWPILVERVPGSVYEGKVIE